MSPFKALYGQECLTPLRLFDLIISIPVAQETLEGMERQLQEIRVNLKRASDRQKSNGDSNCSPKEFKVGDKVFLRIKQKRSFLKLRKFKKIAFRYCDPYEVLKGIGDQAYELALPYHLYVHNVFCVSLLKQSIYTRPTS